METDFQTPPGVSEWMSSHRDLHCGEWSLSVTSGHQTSPHHTFSAHACTRVRSVLSLCFSVSCSGFQTDCWSLVPESLAPDWITQHDHSLTNQMRCLFETKQSIITNTFLCDLWPWLFSLSVSFQSHLGSYSDTRLTKKMDSESHWTEIKLIWWCHLQPDCQTATRKCIRHIDLHVLGQDFSGQGVSPLCMNSITK